jgi:hypothetical protein
VCAPIIKGTRVVVVWLLRQDNGSPHILPTQRCWRNSLSVVRSFLRRQIGDSVIVLAQHNDEHGTSKDQFVLKYSRLTPPQASLRDFQELVRFGRQIRADRCCLSKVGSPI